MIIVKLLFPLFLAMLHMQTTSGHAIWQSPPAPYNITPAAAEPVTPAGDLCSSLLHILEVLAQDNTANCQPMPSNVKGVIPDLCSKAAVEVVNNCKSQNGGSDCLRESRKALNSSELLSSCLCHGYLDMYAGLWTTWKLMCEGQTSLEASMTKKTRAIGIFTVGDYWKKFTKSNQDLLTDFDLINKRMVRDTSVEPSTETIEWTQAKRCWWKCNEEYLLVDYYKEGDKSNQVHKVFVAKEAGPPPDAFCTSGYSGNSGNEDARLHFGFLYMGGESQAFVFVIHPKSWYPYQHRFKTSSITNFFKAGLEAAVNAAAGAAATAAGTAAAGAAIGASAGSIVPVIGNVVGAVVGAGVAANSDDYFGDYLRYIGRGPSC